MNYNGIEKITGLDNLINLIELYIDDNRITNLIELDRLINLQILHLCNNQISEITGLDNLINLRKINLYGNKIEKISGLNKNTNLKVLVLADNKICKLTGLKNLLNLERLTLSNNRITEIPMISIIHMRSLVRFEVDFGLSYIVKRFLNRNQIHNKNILYNNPQNVHDSHIVKQIQDSIYRITIETTISAEHDKDLYFMEIMNCDVLDERGKQHLIEYCSDKTIHSILNLTFEEILVACWKIIRMHKNKSEILNILNQ